MTITLVSTGLSNFEEEKTTTTETVANDLTDNNSSSGDSEEVAVEAEVREVESLELVVEAETSTSSNFLSVDSKPELPLKEEAEDIPSKDVDVDEDEDHGDDGNGGVNEDNDDDELDSASTNTEEGLENEAEKGTERAAARSTNPEAKDEYEVEKIVEHKISRGNVKTYEIKWKGYDATDNTIENAEEMHKSIPSLCIEYWNCLNIERPFNVPDEAEVKVQLADMYSKRKRTSNDDDEEEDNEFKREAKKLKTSNLPKQMIQAGYSVAKPDYPNETTDWKNDIEKFCVRPSRYDENTVFGFIDWKSGKKTVHPIQELHEKIPEELFEYYEQRLSFFN